MGGKTGPAVLHVNSQLKLMSSCSLKRSSFAFSGVPIPYCLSSEPFQSFLLSYGFGRSSKWGMEAWVGRWVERAYLSTKVNAHTCKYLHLCGESPLPQSRLEPGAALYEPCTDCLQLHEMITHFIFFLLSQLFTLMYRFKMEWSLLSIRAPPFILWVRKLTCRASYQCLIHLITIS